MRTLTRTVSAVVVAVTTTPLLVFAPPANAATTYSAPLQTAISQLPVATETTVGYDRALFKHWTDADADSCDTREEVLLTEAVTQPTIGASCALTGGKWFSYYDRAYWTDKSDVDIDHVVALSEAYSSGAHLWTATQREQYANDVGDSRSLVAVTDNVNASKGDRDPAEWMPTYGKCRFVKEWVAVKIRWRLTVDTTEKNALTSHAASCSNTTLTVNRAI